MKDPSLDSAVWPWCFKYVISTLSWIKCLPEKSPGIARVFLLFPQRWPQHQLLARGGGHARVDARHDDDPRQFSVALALKQPERRPQRHRLSRASLGRLRR